MKIFAIFFWVWILAKPGIAQEINTIVKVGAERGVGGYSTQTQSVIKDARRMSVIVGRTITSALPFYLGLAGESYRIATQGFKLHSSVEIKKLTGSGASIVAGWLWRSFQLWVSFGGGRQSAVAKNSSENLSRLQFKGVNLQLGWNIYQTDSALVEINVKIHEKTINEPWEKMGGSHRMRLILLGMSIDLFSR